MATGNSGTFTWSSEWAQVRLYWAETYDLDANTSVVTFRLQFLSTNWTGITFFNNGSLTANGSQLYSYIGSNAVYFGSKNVWYSPTPTSSWSTAAITHDADGSKSISVRLVCQLQTDSAYFPVPSWDKTVTLTLTTIPRASTVMCGDNTIGSLATISVGKAAPSFVHSLRFNWPGDSSNQVVYDANGTAQTQVSSTEILWALTSSQISEAYSRMGSTGTSIQLTLICYTYPSAGSNSRIGTTQTTMKWNLNASDSKPTGTLSLTITNPQTSLTGSASKAILNHSVVSASLAAAAQNSATLASASITNSGTTASGTSSPVTGTFGPITEKKFSWQVKDSRGLTKSDSSSLTVVNYTPPSITVEPGIMAADTGNVTITARGGCWTGSFGSQSNTCTVQVSWRQSGGSWGSWTTMTKTWSSGVFSATYTITGLDPSKTYQVRARVTDALQTVTSSAKTLISRPVFQWFKDLFQFIAPVQFDGGLNGSGAWSDHGNLASDADLHALTEAGFYYVTGTASSTISNVPTTGAAVLLQFQNAALTRIVHLYAFTGTNPVWRLYFEEYNGSAWSGWGSIPLVPPSGRDPAQLLSTSATTVSGQSYSDVQVSGLTTDARVLVQRQYTGTGAPTGVYPICGSCPSNGTLRVYWNSNPSNSTTTINITVAVFY